MRKVFQILLLVVISQSIFAQKGYEIRVQIDNYQEEKIVLAHEFLNRYPVVDTVAVNAQGEYVFQGDSALASGVYMLVLPPENAFVTLMMTEGEQHFSIKSDYNSLSKSIKIEGSLDNQLYYDYMNYLNDQMIQLNAYRQAAAESTDPNEQVKNKELFNQEIDKIRQYQFDLIEKNPKSLTASLIKVELEKEIPEFEGSAQEDLPYLQYEFRKKHYFDYVDLSDERLLNSEALFGKIDYYLNNLTHQQADSINASVDRVLQQLQQSAPNTFKYYLDHLMITYASSDVIGFDAVYVHIVENYYTKGVAPWVKKEDLDEMIEDITARKNILIGQTAPNIEMQLRDGTPIALHDVKADFTVLYLWQPNCSHCKASMPFMKAFYQKYQNKGVKLFSACTKVTDKVPACWEYVDNNEIGGWINTVDPYLRSRFVQIYMAKKTPKIFILDENKTIVMKDIVAEQLDEILEYLIEEKRQKETPAGRS